MKKTISHAAITGVCFIVLLALALGKQHVPVTEDTQSPYNQPPSTQPPWWWNIH